MTGDAEYREVITEVVGGLIAGEARFLGRRVTLSWPDGLPPGWTEDGLQALGQTWIQDSANRQGQWIATADAAAEAVRRQATTEALALSSYFTVHRGPDGEPVALVPLRDQVDFDPYSGGYIVRQEGQGSPAAGVRPPSAGTLLTACEALAAMVADEWPAELSEAISTWGDPEPGQIGAVQELEAYWAATKPQEDQ